MTKLSININKIALIRNARGGNVPDLLKFATDCERYGADGITIHPRPDERHITQKDAYNLKEIVKTEYNIEGYPTPDFLKMVLEIKPDQCTLVPDSPEQLTSDHGWDTEKHFSFLKETIAQLHEKNIRVSLFIDPENSKILKAKEAGSDRIEFYTGPYAENFKINPEKSIFDFVEAAKFCQSIDLGINAGHDLSLVNLNYFWKNIPHLLEVSIGHAFVKDCLYFGLENTLGLYKRKLTAN